MANILKEGGADSSSSGVSIDSFLRDVKNEKRRAIALLRAGSHSEEELERIARAIYFSTFRAALGIKYEDSDERGNTGCIVPMAQILEEVASYGISMNGGFAAGRLAKPAFWFASQAIFEAQVFQHRDPTNPSNSNRLIWRRRDRRADFSSLVADYENEFGHYKPYVVANLRDALNS